MRAFLLSSMISFFFIACSNQGPTHNTLTEKEKQEGWVLLFDGKTTDGWHLYNKGKLASAWLVDSGVLYCHTDPKLEHGDLISDKEYENYELTFDWKINKEGNSGVFLNVAERDSLPTAWTSGPEYQLLDIAHHDYSVVTKRSGCLYGFTPQKNPAPQKEAGEWNQARIKQVNGKVEFYLNGVMTAEQDFTSAAWRDMINQTSFKNFPEFGKYTKGHIALQDWAKGVAFRNIKIREL